MGRAEDLAAASAAALAAAGAQLDAAIADAGVHGAEAKEHARAYAARLGGYVRLALKGEISPEVARMAVERELWALEQLALGLKDVAAQEAMKRVKNVLASAVEIGLALATKALLAL